jgi:hypothetical protein
VSQREDGVIEVQTPHLRHLYDDWLSWRGGRSFPARRDFDPVDIRYVLGKLSLIEVLQDPLRFHYRVHATRFAERLGFDLTGKTLDQLPDTDYRGIIRDHFTCVLEQRAPSVRCRERRLADGRVWRYEVLVLPLAADGECIDMLMSATEFL